MAKEKEITLEEAQEVIKKEEQKVMEEVADKIQVILDEYGFIITSQFEMFGSTVNPPIRLVKKQEQG